MHEHVCLEGPIRGSPGWWQQLGKKASRGAKKKKASKRAGRFNSRSTGNPIRTELVERVRREIEAGTYETPEKWEAALEKFLENLGH